MTPVYEAENGIDAQLVCDLLLSAGLQAQVLGADLAGGIGELPAGGLVRVWVAPQQHEQARALIDEWQAGGIPDEDELNRLADSATPNGELWA
ncbi:putative signal transducing protein [Arenimonas alkanexedens]